MSGSTLEQELATRHEYDQAFLRRNKDTLNMLKAMGIKKYADGTGLDVEFFANEPPAPPEQKKKDEIDVCACGHPEHAHMGGFCVEGCDASKCNPQKDEVK